LLVPSGIGMLGMGLQGVGMLAAGISSTAIAAIGLNTFGIGTALIAFSAEASAWFLSSGQPELQGFNFGGKLRSDERIVIFPRGRNQLEFMSFDPSGVSAQSLDEATSAQNAYFNAFSCQPLSGENCWETTGGQIASVRRFAHFDYGVISETQGHVSIYGGNPRFYLDPVEFIRIWTQNTFPLSGLIFRGGSPWLFLIDPICLTHLDSESRWMA